MSVVNYDWDELEDDIVEEYDDPGNTIAENTTEPGLFGRVISQRRNGVDSFYHFDGQGSTVALTDANGSVTDTYAYDAFGEITAQVGGTVNPFQFGGEIGYYFDIDTGDHEIRRREYESDFGRWSSIDPLITPALSSFFSSYVYAENNCANRVDPSGYWPICFSTTCTNNFFGGAKEGIYGLKIEVVEGVNAKCGPTGPKINFTYKETHVPPPGVLGGLNPFTNKQSPCLEPANAELSKITLKALRFGKIVDRNCSAPVLKTSTTVPGGCITIEVTTSCETKCNPNTCTCGPQLPWLGIYPPGWNAFGFGGVNGILPSAILAQAEIAYEEQHASCGLTGCKATAHLFRLDVWAPGKLGTYGTIPPDPQKPGEIPRYPRDPNDDWDGFLFAGIPTTAKCTAAEEWHLWGLP